MSDRLNWYRELDELGRRVGTSPTVELRGRLWDVTPSAISRTVAKTTVALPMGDLTDFEVGECLKAMRLQVVNETGLPNRPENLPELPLGRCSPSEAP